MEKQATLYQRLLKLLETEKTEAEILRKGIAIRDSIKNFQDNIALNKKLLREVTAKDYDLDRIEDLLKQGAQPLGYIDEDKEECAFTEMLCDMADNINNPENDDYNIPNEKLSKIVRLFLNYGMLEHLFYDELTDKEYLPLWEMQFCCCKDAAISLKMILDDGYRGDSIDDFIEHFFVDTGLAGDMSLTDKWWIYDLEWGTRMTMLIASYPDILKNDGYLRTCICLNENDISYLKSFRDIERYSYHFEYNDERCGETSNLYYVYIKDGDKTIWTLRI